MRQKGSTSLRHIKDPLLENYYIKVDDNCMTLVETIVSDGGKTYEKPVSYHTSFDKVLAAFVKEKVNATSYDSIQEYLDNYKTLTNQITAKFL